MWKIVQCAVQGRSHIKTGIPCQDKTFSIIKKGVSVIALADGAGSAKLSHFGAERITKFICDDFAKNFDDYFVEEDGVSIKRELISKILVELGNLSKELECELKELASTMMFVAVKDDQFIISHIGDGVVGYLKDDELKIASQPENGEYANTTVFTTSKDALNTMKLLKGNLGNIQGFVLMSDGTEASLYNKREKRLADILKKIMNLCMVVPQEKIEQQLINSFESTIKKATTDDCSIALMINDIDSFPGYTKLREDEKAKLLGFDIGTIPKKRLKRYDDILGGLVSERTLKDISGVIHLKPKYTRRYLNRLLHLNLIEIKGAKYQTIVIMDLKPARF